MKIELTPDAAQWVEAEIAAGTFPTAEDAVRYAIQKTKTDALRAKLDAAVAEGGENTPEEVLEFVRQHLDAAKQLAPIVA
jgi:Arc/MetJ-type ribon-helix-helix transcriptional regulator